MKMILKTSWPYNKLQQKHCAYLTVAVDKFKFQTTNPDPIFLCEYGNLYRQGSSAAEIDRFSIMQMTTEFR